MTRPYVRKTPQVQETPVPQTNSADAEITATAQLPTTEAAKVRAEIERIRKFRKPLGAFQQKLALDKRPGYHRHWFNDIAGRIDEAQANGWVHVLGKDSKPLKRIVDRRTDGAGLQAYAMELPLEFWEEDMAARHEAASAVIESTRKNPIMSQPGQAKASDAGAFYTPQETGGGALQIHKG